MVARAVRGDIADGVLYGRGAVDMKGAIACKVAATLDHLAANGGKPKGSISFLITGDEEGVAVNGSPKLLQWAAARGEKFDHCVLGEPGNVDELGDTIKLGRRGSQNGVLVVTGKMGHVAYPHRADNPVRGLVKLMSALMDEPLDQGSHKFDPSNLEFTSIDIGNPTVNLIPGEARARFNIRFNDCHSYASLRTLVEQRAGKGRRRQGALADRLGAVERRRVLHRAEPVHRRGGRRGGRGDRQDAQAVDLRRHVGCALHQGLLPGGGVRSGRPDHARHRRARAGQDLQTLTAVYRKILDNYFR